jgi:hypothetical protein
MKADMSEAISAAYEGLNDGNHTEIGYQAADFVVDTTYNVLSSAWDYLSSGWTKGADKTEPQIDLALANQT